MTDDASGRLTATPIGDALPRRFSDFATLGEALDYAAQGVRGLNFHDPRGKLSRAYSYAELRTDAHATAHRLIGRGVKPGDRVALVAETCPDFAALFFGAVYAGAWPVPLPLPTSFGGRDAYIDQLKVQLGSCDPILLCHPAELAASAKAAAEACGVTAAAWEDLANEPAIAGDLPQARADDIAYLQYSSGSTRFPHGVVITHARARRDC